MKRSDSEIWASIPKYEGLYEVSNFGKIKSLITNKILKPNITRGYQYVSLYKNKKAKSNI
jgi:hypothetical protein